MNLIEFIENNISHRIVDVGGQKTERRKWIYCFDVLFSSIKYYERPLLVTLLECNDDYFSGFSDRI